MRFKHHYKIEIGHLDIAPLIDVVFLLLIFFMLTSTFVVASGIKIDLPQAQSKEVTEQKGLMITIDKKGDIYLGDKKERVNFGELRLALKCLKRDNRKVGIYADKQTALQKLMEVWDVCRESEIEEIGISAIPK